jgi:hypothetical protein
MRFSCLLLLAAALLPAPARASAIGDLCRQNGGSDCEKPRGYVHPAGWIVDGSCLQDARFTPAQLRAALDEAARKFSPKVPVSAGGCLADYNPAWAKELTDFLHTTPVRISCPAYDPAGRPCADEGASPGFGPEIHIRNAGPCLAEGGTGLAGLLFHETLHAAGADNLPLERHNKAGELPQYAFVTDRIYGTEALCFLGVDPAKRKQVNILQCRAAVNYENDHPDRALCSGFSTEFYDTIPPGFLKH